MLERFISRRRSSADKDITPGDIFLDSSNLPGMAVEQLEGRIEHPVSVRAVWMVGAAFALVAAAFVFQLYHLEIKNGAQFALAAQQNRLEQSLIFAQRGVIYDRTGKLLAWNESQNEASSSRALPYELRTYSDLAGLGHILGYVNYPKADSTGAWWRTDLSGVAGVELAYNDTLAGHNGTEMTEVDAHANIERQSLIKPPQDGQSITLSIDAELQSKLYTILRDHAAEQHFQGGAGIIMDIHTGEIIAMTSVPEFDPQALTNGNRTLIHQYDSNPQKPFLNRAIAGVYTPGSIVKPIFAAGALTEGIISPDKSIYSPGYITIPNPYDASKPTIIKDWRVNGWTNMKEAISVSSDVYFFAIGGGYEDQPGLGITRLDKWAKIFGLGAETGFNVGNESEGTIPSPDWKAQTFPDDPTWRIGDTYNTSIGQYGFQVTPLQMVRVIAAIANGGSLPAPHIIASTTPSMTQVGVTNANLDIIRQGMRLAVTSPVGTTRSLNIPDFPIAGKTGTAQLGSKNQFMNSWVVGFWPYDNPKYAFAVVLEKAPAGTLSGAAPAMRGFFDWLDKRSAAADTAAAVQEIDVAH